MTREIRNVVLVIVDALRRDAVGAFGGDRNLTPTIDRLAGEGTAFERAFTCTNTTDPSITSIHTGRDPASVVTHHGPFVTPAEKRRAEAVESAPELIGEAGIFTAVTGRTLGRWHKRGFDHYPEPSLGRYRRRALGERLERVSPRLRQFAGSLYERLSAAVESESDEVDALLEVVDDGPFYAMVHMMDTHVPYSHDPDVVEELLDRHEYPDQDLRSFFDEHGDNEYVDETMREYSDERDHRDGLARWFAKYDAAVVRADRKIGRLVEGLRTRGLADETAVVVTSDHGESLDEHGIFFEHHGLYEPQVRVPLVVQGPTIPAASREEFVQLYDLAPTLLDLLGVDSSLDCEGRSLLPLLGGPGGWDDRDHVVLQEAHAQSRIGIRTREYKYLKHVRDEVLEERRGDSLECGYCGTLHGAERELYALGDDADEHHNVVDDHGEVVEHLDDRLSRYFEDIDAVSPGDGDVTYEHEEELMDRLEELGYR